MRTWTKPVIKTMDEQELLKQIAVKAASVPHNDLHSDAHTNSGSGG